MGKFATETVLQSAKSILGSEIHLFGVLVCGLGVLVGAFLNWNGVFCVFCIGMVYLLFGMVHLVFSSQTK